MKRIFVTVTTLLCVFLFIPAISAEENTLQNLIDQASPNDTLELEAKVYEENIKIDKPLTITGQKGTVIQGDQTRNVIEIDSEDVTLNQLEVKGSGMSRDSKEEHSGIRVMGNNTILENLTVKDSYHGVLLNRIDNTTMNNLTIIGDPEKVLSEQGNGIHVLRSSEVTIEDSHIEYFRDGVYMEYSDNNEINHNTMTKMRYGLHYMYADNNSFDDNRFVKNIGGAAIMHSDYNTLKNNEFSFNQGSNSFGLLIQTSREIHVLENEFHLNQRGLLVEQSTGNEIEGNDFFKNKIGVELWASASANVFSENSFRENTNHILTVGGTAENEWSDMFGNGNYWDEPQLDLNEDGVGDMPFEYTSSLGNLIESNDELAYLFLESPAVEIYEKTNDILGNQDVMAVDDHPMLVARENNNFVLIISIVVIVAGAVYYILKRRRGKKNG